jgi:adenylosuccinate lyase
MSFDPILALGALDGRYRTKVEPLAALLSEFGLMHARVEIECQWFVTLAATPEVAELPPLNDSQLQAITQIHTEFSVADANRIKTLERTTNHDVKAVEYFVKESIGKIEGLAPHIEFVHFACTSEDINNLSHALMLSRGRSVLTEAMHRLLTEIKTLAETTAELAMLSRTHGQPASPTTLGKELANVHQRLASQCRQFSELQALGKMNGAVGNFNAHVAAYPNVDWESVSATFVESLGITCNRYTTQIEPHDYIAEWFHALSRFNQILLDFNRDIWSYIAIDYFKQRKVEGETGSSTMPHKVNPIDFENSEGNLGIANALLDHMAAKLQVSRWQRDLSDSTVLRNIGSAFGHCLVAFESTLKGMSRLDVNEQAITADLMDRWEVLGEAIQTVMRRYGCPEPYEQLKRLTRGQQMDAELYHEVLAGLDIPAAAKTELEALTPSTYIGIAAKLAKSC